MWHQGGWWADLHWDVCLYIVFIWHLTPWSLYCLNRDQMKKQSCRVYTTSDCQVRRHQQASVSAFFPPFPSRWGPPGTDTGATVRYWDWVFTFLFWSYFLFPFFIFPFPSLLFLPSFYLYCFLCYFYFCFIFFPSFFLSFLLSFTPSLCTVFNGRGAAGQRR